MSYNDSYRGGGDGGNYGGGRDEYRSGDRTYGGGYGGGDSGYSGGGGRQEYGSNQGGSYGGDSGSYGGDSGSYGGGGRHGGDGGGYGNQGGSQYNRPGGQSYDDDDFSGAMHHANEHSGSSGESSLFSSALGLLSGNKQNIQNEDIDERQAVNAHQAMYGGGGGRDHSSETVGAGAAMQALKMFTGGESGGGHAGGMGAGSSGGGSSQNQMIGMAMAQASKMFDEQQGNGKLQQGADKQSAVNSAAKMALKMYLKNQGGGGGGMGGLVSNLL